MDDFFLFKPRNFLRLPTIQRRIRWDWEETGSHILLCHSIEKAVEKKLRNTNSDSASSLSM